MPTISGSGGAAQWQPGPKPIQHAKPDRAIINAKIRIAKLRFSESAVFFSVHLVCIKKVSVANVEPAATDNGMGPTVTFSAFGNIE